MGSVPPDRTPLAAPAPAQPHPRHLDPHHPPKPAPTGSRHTPEATPTGSLRTPKPPPARMPPPTEGPARRKPPPAARTTRDLRLPERPAAFANPRRPQPPLVRAARNHYSPERLAPSLIRAARNHRSPERPAAFAHPRRPQPTSPRPSAAFAGPAIPTIAHRTTRNLRSPHDPQPSLARTIRDHRSSVPSQPSLTRTTRNLHPSAPSVTLVRPRRWRSSLSRAVPGGWSLVPRYTVHVCTLRTLTPLAPVSLHFHLCPPLSPCPSGRGRAGRRGSGGDRSPRRADRSPRPVRPSVAGTGTAAARVAGPGRNSRWFVRQSDGTTEVGGQRHVDDVHFVTFRLRQITPNTLRNPFSWIS